jgi:hypothetical protein
MLNSIAKLLLVLTSFAPVLLTFSFIQYRHTAFYPAGLACLLVAVGLCLLCILIIRAARQQLETMTFAVNSVKTADTEIVGFVVAYLLPLVTTAVEVPVILFVLGIFLLVVWSTNSYHFNPLLSLFGYHFYEVQSSNAVTYVLVTRRTMRDAHRIARVVLLTEYMVLDVEKAS